MGRLIKSHWARLIVLTAAVIQVAASVEGFWWPKIFWDFSTTALDRLVKPFPFLQIVNILLGLSVFSLEWPVKYIAGTAIHRNIISRILLYPIFSFPAILMYQSTNAFVAYMVGTGIYTWAIFEGESISAEPWAIPDAKGLP